MQNLEWRVDVDKVLGELEIKIQDARTEPKALVPTELLLKIRKAFSQILEPQKPAPLT